MKHKGKKKLSTVCWYSLCHVTSQGLEQLRALCRPFGTVSSHSRKILFGNSTVPVLRISLQKGTKGSKAFERNPVLDRKSRSSSKFFLIKKKHVFVFLARESVYALAFSAVEMLKDTCKQKSIFPLGYEASADGSGSLQAWFFVSACRSSLTLH